MKAVKTLNVCKNRLEHQIFSGYNFSKTHQKRDGKIVPTLGYLYAITAAVLISRGEKATRKSIFLASGSKPGRKYTVGYHNNIFCMLSNSGVLVYNKKIKSYELGESFPEVANTGLNNSLVLRGV